MLENINIITIGIVILVGVLWYFTPRRPGNVPPGPKEFPIVGNIPSLVGRDAMECFSVLRKKFGDIYGLYIGQEFTVILNGYDVIHEALVRNGDIFSRRPRSEFHQLMFKNQGIVFANGKMWKESRKFSQMALNEFGYEWTEKSIEERIQEEVNHFLTRIASFQEPFDITESVQLSVANVVAGILFGHRCEYDDHAFVACLHSVSEAARLFSRSSLLMSCFPALQKIPGDLLGINKIMQIRQKPKDFIRKEFLRHRQTYKEKKRTNVMDMFSMEMENGNSSIYTDRQMHALMAELLSAGSETTATTIIWIVLYLIRNLELQKRLHKEVDEVIGKVKRPELQHRKQLPLLEATILEGLRIAPVAPLSVPHAVHEDVIFRGYWIPKDTTILVNLHSVLKDPEIWGDPDRFRPERFLKDDDSLVHVPKEHIPFCMGRRACLGESLARMELFMYMACLLQKFEFLPAEEGHIPTVNGHLGMTYSPSTFKVRLECR